MKDYIRKLVVNKWVRDALQSLFKLDRVGASEEEKKERKARELEELKDMLEDCLRRGALTVYEYYIIIGYLTEYAFGSHFQDLPSV